MSVAPVVDYDPTRDKSYQQTRLGRSVADFLAWKRTGRAAERTLDQYERDLARGCLMFPNHGLAEFGTSELLHVSASFKDGERRVRVAAWKSFFKWALRMGLIESNPADRLPDIKAEPQKFIDTFSDEEIAVLTALPVRDGALMQLLFDGGLRKAEARNFRLLHLRVRTLSERGVATNAVGSKRDSSEHVDPVPGVPGSALAPRSESVAEIVILKGKGGKDRVLPASRDVVRKVNELALLDGLHAQDHLWYSRPGGGKVLNRSKPVVDTSFARWWTRCLEQAGVPYRNPHVTRHTFATRWLRRGGRLDLLSMAMGHASIKTTYDLYAHLDTRDLAQEFALLFPTGVES